MTKVLERFLESLIHSKVDIINMQFGFMPGRSTTDVIYILQQIQEKHLIKKKKIYFAFVDQENAFDNVLHPLLWWAMRKLEIDELIARLMKAMYNAADSRVRVNVCFNKRFEVAVGVHQGSVLSLLLFAIVMEALSHDCCIGCPW